MPLGNGPGCTRRCCYGVGIVDLRKRRRLPWRRSLTAFAACVLAGVIGCGLEPLVLANAGPPAVLVAQLGDDVGDAKLDHDSPLPGPTAIGAPALRRAVPPRSHRWAAHAMPSGRRPIAACCYPPAVLLSGRERLTHLCIALR